MPRIHAADASVIARKLLEYIVSDEDALVRFLGLTGLAPQDLRRLAGDPAFHGAVLDHALQDEVLLAWEMNGEPLDEKHGAPLRLVVPGWFGIAWVKWLNRIDVIDRRFMGKWMAREYVTIRGEQRDGEDTNWRETSVCNINVKSICARVVRLGNGVHRITGAAWSDGTPLTKVEVRVDDGPWRPATMEKKPVRGSDGKFTWSLWSFDWAGAVPGEHTVVSRATDDDGRIQPPPEDPSIKNKRQEAFQDPD